MEDIPEQFYLFFLNTESDWPILGRGLRCCCGNDYIFQSAPWYQRMKKTVSWDQETSASFARGPLGGHRRGRGCNSCISSAGGDNFSHQSKACGLIVIRDTAKHCVCVPVSSSCRHKVPRLGLKQQTLLSHSGWSHMEMPGEASPWLVDSGLLPAFPRSYLSPCLCPNFLVFGRRRSPCIRDHPNNLVSTSLKILSKCGHVLSCSHIHLGVTVWSLML